MVNFRKMDDKDFVFINKPLDEQEEKEFSEFLKTRKAKTLTRKRLLQTSQAKRGKREVSTSY